MPTYEKPPRFMKIAHRGASSYAPENTFAAYDKALEMGIDQIELDVHFTRDDHLVVFHDDTVDRTSNGTGPVLEHTLDEMRSLDAGSWFGPEYAGERVRSLAELFEHYKGRLYFHIEIKGRSVGLARRTIDMVRGHGLTDGVTITSFSRDRLAEASAYDSELPKGWLIPPGQNPWEDTYIAQCATLGLTQICFRGDLATPEFVESIHKAGYQARPWGITDEDIMRRAVDSGADGMTINFPDKLLEYLRAKGIE